MPKSPRIQILLDQAAIPPATAKVLRKLGAEIELSSFDRHDRPRSSTPIDMRLIITPSGDELRTTRLAQLIHCCDANPCGTLVLSLGEMTSQEVMDSALTDRGVTFAFNPTEDELSAQMAVLSGMRGPIGAMRRELKELRNRELRHVANLRKFDDERRLAGLVQREFLNHELPDIQDCEWSTLYRPAEIVSGDMFEVVRLNRDQVAITLLDATGHGLTAALLAAYGRRAVHDEIAAANSLENFPSGVLRRMNHELVKADLSECQFISAIQAVFNERTNEMTWARGGGCYPILVRHNQPPMQVRSHGPLVGVEAESQFETVRLQLEPGDTVLFYTDGLDGLLRDEGAGNYASDITETEWFAALNDETIHERIAAIEKRLDDSMHGPQADDVTVIGLHLQGAEERADVQSTEGEYSLAGTYL